MMPDNSPGLSRRAVATLIGFAVVVPVIGTWILVDSMIASGWSSVPIGIAGVALGAVTIVVLCRTLIRRSGGGSLSESRGRYWAVGGAAVLIVGMRAVDGLSEVFINGLLLGGFCVLVIVFGLLFSGRTAPIIRP